jgi:glutaredoxin
VIILYSTGCPKCKVLKEKLKASDIQYTEITDTAVMMEQGIDAVPVLEVEGVKMEFVVANEWIKSRSDKNEYTD